MVIRLPSGPDAEGGTRRPGVELHVEELVLYGFAPGDRLRIGDSLERELARLFAQFGVPAAVLSGGEVAGLDAGSFAVPENATPETIGARLAAAVYGGMKRC